MLAFVMLLVPPDIALCAANTEKPEAPETLKACYSIEEGSYDADTGTQTYQVYLDYDAARCSLYTGTFGLKYDAALDLSFTLDKENFGYFQNFNLGNGSVAFQWVYVKEFRPEDKEQFPQPELLRRAKREAARIERLRLGTISVKGIGMTDTIPCYPAGWHTKTLGQLDWLTTSVSKEPKYTDNSDNVCLNDEIWRALVPPEQPEPEPTDEPPAADDTTDETPDDPDGETDVFQKGQQPDGYYQGYNMLDEDRPEWIDIGFWWDSGYPLPEKDGRTITGLVSSYNPNNPVTVALYRKGETESVTQLVQSVYTTIAPSGKVTCSYSVNVSDPGEYTLEIRKDVHLTYRMEVTVPAEASEVSQKPVTLFCGDISGDEKIKQNDRTTLLKYMNTQVYHGETEAGAALRRSDLDGDGKITIHDFNIFKTYYNRTYEEAVSNGV